MRSSMLPRLARHTNGHYLIALIFGFLSLSACGPRPDLPPIPPVDTSGVLADVAAQIEEAKSNVERSPNNHIANGQYGLILATYGRDEAAAVALERARLLSPKEPRWAFFHGFVLRRLGQTGQALATIENGLEASPDQIDLLVKRAELLFDLARFDEAEADIDSALVENPKYPLAQYYKGRIHLQRGNFAEAIDRFEKMLSDGIRVSEVHFNLATAYRLKGNADKAATQQNLSEKSGYLKIAGFDPANMKLDSLNIGDQPHIVRAAEHYRTGNVDQAITELQTALEKNPENLIAHVNLVRMYGQKKNLESALRHYNKAKAIDPDFDQLDSNLGYAYQYSADHENAAIAYTRAAKRKPNDAAIQAELGFALGKTGKLDQAIVHFKNSLEIQPVNRDLRYILGEALVRERRFQEAIEIFETALVPEDQKTVAVLRSTGRTHVLAGNKKRAIDSLNKALRLAGKFNNTRLTEAIRADIDRVKLIETND